MQQTFLATCIAVMFNLRTVSGVNKSLLWSNLNCVSFIRELCLEPSYFIGFL